MGEEKEITITYETLFELLRREKTREELQKLNPTFFKDVVGYLREKQELFKAQQDELFFADEKGKTHMQLQNIRKIITELYDRREKKIFNLAMIRARTKGLVDVSALLDEEKRLFDSLVGLLDGFRGGILLPLLQGGMPNLVLQASPATPPKLEQRMPMPPIAQPVVAPKAELPKEEPPRIEPPARESIPLTPRPDASKSGAVLVRFTHPMPKFVGPRLEVYGPFAQDDTAELPEQIAKVLIEKGRAAAEDSAKQPQEGHIEAI